MDDLIDLARASTICDGDLDLYMSLVGILLNEKDEMLEEAEASLHSADASAAEDAVHRLKGALRNLACAQAVQLLQEVENAARAGRLEHARTLWEKALPTVQRTFQYLAEGSWKEGFPRPTERV